MNGGEEDRLVPTPQITIDELISELGKVQSEVPGAMDGITLLELCGAWGVSEDVVRRKLRSLNMSGKLVAGKRRTIDIAGRANWTPTYRVRLDKKGKK